MLGGTQAAWIKYGFIIALVVILMLSICYMNGHKAKLVDEVEGNTVQSVKEEAVPLKDALGIDEKQILDYPGVI